MVKMKLKTLKEIEIDKEMISSGNRSKHIKDKIKQEAIKILNSDTKDLCKFIGVGCLTQENLMIIDLLLRKVFNITKEDLKGGNE